MFSYFWKNNCGIFFTIHILDSLTTIHKKKNAVQENVFQKLY